MAVDLKRLEVQIVDWMLSVKFLLSFLFTLLLSFGLPGLCFRQLLLGFDICHGRSELKTDFLKERFFASYCLFCCR
ncbi:MAG: hypothetical protein BGP24_12020 [Lysobacterales bacterium 69-70]|nr:MAG: hypothetical protein ABS97_21785 [Xanthomonadaceae bacterium SCN 69-320]ODV15596.1 MAG: hypothetical protein ABT27_22530 [Xanthomonadaceae bacterium SCN 69-25]OJY98520.1 MAG: hypothetical protein BGP24_12020 [Xanthomonadales bacterium 69-70]